MDIKESRAVMERHMLSQADSVGELLEQFRDRIPSALIDGPGWDKLVERGHGLPISLATAGFGFEVPLHDPEPRADLGLALFGGSHSAAHFEEWSRSRTADPSAAAVVRLLREVGREESALHRVAGDKMLLEYDIDPGLRGAPPNPGIFLYPNDDALPSNPSASQREDLGLIIDAVAEASGWEPDAGEQRQAQRVYQTVPEGTCIGAVGAFPARTRGLRLAVTGLRTTRDATSFLERIGWPGRPQTVSALASDLENRGAFAHLALHLDIRADGVGPVLGVSCYASDEQWVRAAQPWIPLIDRLRERDLTVPEKSSALADSWSGAETAFGRGGMLVIVRGIHHIKLVLADDRWEQVKAYVFQLVFPPFPAVQPTELAE